MAKFLINRVLALIPALLAVSLIVFLLLHLAPGDPTYLIAGRNASKEVLERTRQQLGLDRPLPEQYLTFLRGVVRGDLGTSIRFRRPVTELIGQRIPHTMLLGFSGLLICYLIGVPTGLLAAVRRGHAIEAVALGGSLLGMSLPSFWFGLMLLLVFAVKIPLLPVTGYESPIHLILPALTIGVGQAAWVTRLVRSSMLDVLRQDFVRTARAKGLTQRVVLYKHGLRNALVPVITLFGMQVGWLIAGTVVIESVFVWPGVGRLLVDAIITHDYPVVQGVLLVLAVSIAIGNTIADMLYHIVDPRIAL